MGVHARAVSAALLVIIGSCSGQQLAGASLNSCVPAGECLPCAKSEMSEPFCKASGHKLELLCLVDGANTTTFKSCTLVSTAYQGFHDVMMFEVVMLLVLLVAFQALRKEKLKHVSSFDMRKDLKQPSKPFEI
ncbi:hypothetical protein H310_01080 [Aphanomyces invadans]|uniref:Uncharacterized protein n=1 Tax=Aphanomyces invadans TaxID=157072 RepID=A0A024UQ10_9STRA|nr:hypothetical protein H310_01080 [Aphanomyces invadans]ETW08516.1 hypothetical protein H310_01080 [Aphanomyces invadans]|eukprot:XP_008862321.1 hypothetical protein H310_01080 [Aphanomyces invadans]